MPGLVARGCSSPGGKVRKKKKKITYLLAEIIAPHMTGNDVYGTKGGDQDELVYSSQKLAKEKTRRD